MEEEKGIISENKSLNSMSIRSCPELGRYLVAEADFSPRELLFEEFPIVSAPSGQTDPFENGGEDNNDFYPICISCFLSITDFYSNESESFNCQYCQWPFCSKSCADLDMDHERMECPLLREKEVKQNTETLRLIYFIRCIYLSNNDKSKWNQLLNLSPTYDPERGKAAKEPGNKDLAIHEDLQSIYDDPVSIELVTLLNGIRSVNAFQVNYSELDDKRYYGMVLYSKASMASHSCTPNIQWRIKPDKKRGYPIRLLANDYIEKGDIVSIAYRNKCLTSGTLRRREEIFSGHGFLCCCDRCSDNTEFRTFFSALHCTHCETGYLLPQNCLDPKSDWSCQDCNGIETVSYASEVLDRITGQIYKAKEGKCKSSETCWKLDIIIRKYSGKVLHKNHYLIIWAQFLWLQYLEHHLQFYQSNSLKYDIFLLMTRRAIHCKEIYTKFFSTHSRFYGYFEKLIGFAMYLYYYLTPITWDRMSDEQKLRSMRETLEHFENSLRYDGWDSEDLKFIEAKLQHIKSTVAKILIKTDSCTAL